jgi:hypothetical protein
MGGKRKTLTNTRRTALKKEMTDALIAGTFTTNGRPVDEVLDEVKAGIEEGRYPIEVNLQTLIGIWTGTPAPTAAPAPEPQPTNHGTVDQIQQAVAQQNGHAPPVAQVMPTQQIQQPSPAEQAMTQYPIVSPETAAAIGYPQFPSQQPSQLAPAVGTAPGQMVPTAVGAQPVLQPDNGAGYAIPEQHPGQGMTLQQAQAAMSTAESIEIGQPPKDPPIEIDATPVADWLNLAKQADAKIKALKDIYEQAKANAAAYADQVGGPDRSKVLLLNGQLVMRRTFVKKKVFQKEALLAAHPEIDPETFTEFTSFYKTELQ